MFQLRVGLFQGCVIEMGGRIGVSIFLFKSRYIVGDIIVDCTDPLQINAEGRIYQQGTKEAAEQTPDS